MFFLSAVRTNDRKKVALLKTEVFLSLAKRPDLSCYLIVFSSALDHWINIAEYNAFLFKIAVNLVYFVTQLLVLTVRKYGLCGSQHCGNTSQTEFEVHFSFDFVCVHL